jgi:hypothetical protein
VLSDPDSDDDALSVDDSADMDLRPPSLNGGLAAVTSSSAGIAAPGGGTTAEFTAASLILALLSGQMLDLKKLDNSFVSNHIARTKLKAIVLVLPPRLSAAIQTDHKTALA